MSQTRQNCKWIPTRPKRLVSDETGGQYTNYDHPDLLRVLRALDDYEKWISTRLLPIACKWIDENRESVIENLSPEEMDDVGAAIEAAYQLLAHSDWMAERIRASEALDHATAIFNPIWQETTRRFVEAEESVKRQS